MFFQSMIVKLLNILDKLSYRTAFGLSISDKLKIIYYWNIGNKKYPERCLCGGKVYTRGIPLDGWEIACNSCQMIFDED